MLTLLVLGCGLLGSSPPAPPEAPTTSAQAPADAPNVLFIVWDTVRADRMSIYGHSVDTTPRMAAWAKKGVVYDNAVSPGVWTLPSHASLFTGLAVRSHGVGDDHKWLDDHAVTFAELLQEAGYETFAWSSNPLVSRKTNLLQGFDVVSHPWSKKRVAKARKVQAARAPGKNQDTDTHGWNMSAVGPMAVQRFLAWRGARDGDRPWLGFINLMEAHTQRTPTMNARKAVMPADLAERSLTADQRSRTQHQWMVGTRPWPDEDGMTMLRGVYDATLWDLDTITATLLDRLDKVDALDNTLVILVSDHGELLGEHDMVGHQLGVWAELTRVPLIVLHQGVLPPGRNTKPTNTAEVFGMILEATGLHEHPDADAGQQWSRNEHGMVTEYLKVPDATVRLLRDLSPKINLKVRAQPWTALEYGSQAYHHSSAQGWTVWDMDASPGQTVRGSNPREGRKHLAAWAVTVPVYDISTADPVEESIDEGPAREALRQLGYVE